jgi:ketoreductase RED2
MSLQGKVAVVTGSASGIGAAVARSLAAAGAAIVVNSSKSAAAGQAVADSLPRAIYVQADVADDGACVALAAAAQAEFGRIDVLVNNAGRRRSSRMPTSRPPPTRYGCGSSG